MTIRFAPALAVLAALSAALPAFAADLDGGPAVPPPRRLPVPLAGVLVGPRPCPTPHYVTRAPTNAPDDPTYVGSSYGLGKPSYYGTVPPLGIDDPYGRLLRAC